MPTRTFERRKEQSLGAFVSSGNLGNGADQHGPLGTNSEGTDFRSCIRFQHDWTGMTSIQSAVLRLRSTANNNHISKASSNVQVWKLNQSFTEAGGGENYWQNKGTVYPGPTRTSRVDHSVGAGGGVDHYIDITDIVRRWAPAHVDVAGSPGLGEANYGIGLAVDSGDRWEYQSIRGSNKPNLVVTYTSAAVPTIDFLSPTDDEWKHADVQHVSDPGQAMTAVLRWITTLGPTDTGLTQHDWKLEDTTPTTIDSGSVPGELTPVIETVPLIPGQEYTLTVTALGDSGTGTTVRTITFVFPVGEAVHQVSLGQDPTGIGVSRILVPLGGGLDTHVTHYALSTDGTEGGIVGGWTTEPQQPASGAWWLLIRTRIHRTIPEYVPSTPDGVSQYRVAWRGTI